MRQRINNLIATASFILIVVLLGMFLTPLEAWFVAVGVPLNLAFPTAMAVLIGIGVMPAAFLMIPVHRRRHRPYRRRRSS